MQEDAETSNVIEPSVPDPVTTEPSVPDPVITEPSVPDPVITEPSVPDPVITKIPVEKTIKKKNNKIKKKRGPSSYILFTQDYRKSYEGEPLSLADMSKACGEAWAKVSDEDKKKYKEQADSIKDEIKSQLPPPPKKRQVSSYLAFAMEKRKEIVKNNPDLKLGEISKICGQFWKELSKEDKEEWRVTAKNRATE